MPLIFSKDSTFILFFISFVWIGIINNILLSHQTKTNKDMKTKINKSQLFKMAWSMYKRSISVLGREFCQSFSACLRNAWFKMKAEARKAEKEARRLMRKLESAQKPESVVFDATMERGITEYYRNQSGRYCGD